MKLKEFGPLGGGPHPKFYYVDLPLPTEVSAIPTFTQFFQESLQWQEVTALAKNRQYPQ